MCSKQWVSKWRLSLVELESRKNTNRNFRNSCVVVKFNVMHPNIPDLEIFHTRCSEKKKNEMKFIYSKNLCSSIISFGPINVL